LDLTGVDTRPSLELETREPVADGRSASHCPCRSVERGEDSVTRHVDLAATETGELGAHHSMVPGQQLLPGSVPELHSLPGRADEIGEQERREHAVRLDILLDPRQEALDLVEQLLLVTLPWKMVSPGQFDDSCARDELAHESGPLAEVLLRPECDQRR